MLVARIGLGLLMVSVGACAAGAERGSNVIDMLSPHAANDAGAADPIDLGPLDPIDAPAVDPDADASAACTGGRDEVFVLQALTPGYINPLDGSLPGYDLDTSNNLRDADLVANIDNAIGRNEAAFENLFELRALLAQNVTQGNLLLLVRLHHVDDRMNDSCIDVDIVQAGVLSNEGAPVLDDAGFVLAGQTFAPIAGSFLADGVTPVTRLQRVEIRNGHVHAQGATLPLLIKVAGASAPIPMIRIHDLQIDFDLGAEQISGGIIGGGLRINEWVSSFDGAPYDVEGLPEYLRGFADLDRDASTGHYQTISSAFVFRGVSAIATRTDELLCNGVHHLCGDECVADQDNSPVTGCAQTCTGEPCPSPEHASAYCSASAQCRFECEAGYILDSSGTLCVPG